MIQLFLGRRQTILKDAMSVKNVLGGKTLKEKKLEYPWSKEQGMGTPLAEYSESGPFSCSVCWYLKCAEPRKDPEGLCNEPHMLHDPDTKKQVVKGQPYATVNKYFGCCRFIDPVDTGEPKKEFVFAGEPEEESEEHEEMAEGDYGENAEPAEEEEEAEGEEKE
jgi:hypothetical protein